MSKKQMILQFAGGPHANLQEAGQFSISAPAASLGDIGRYRRHSPPCLTGQAKELILREAPCGFVDGQRELMGSLPHFKRLEVPHITLPLLNSSPYALCPFIPSLNPSPLRR